MNTFRSYAQAKRVSRNEGHPGGDPHHYVKLPSGRWCRVYGGPPSEKDLLDPGQKLVQTSRRAWKIVNAPN